jgi:hypothetical protein
MFGGRWFEEIRIQSAFFPIFTTLIIINEHLPFWNVFCLRIIFKFLFVGHLFCPDHWPVSHMTPQFRCHHHNQLTQLDDVMDLWQFKFDINYKLIFVTATNHVEQQNLPVSDMTQKFRCHHHNRLIQFADVMDLKCD